MDYSNDRFVRRQRALEAIMLHITSAQVIAGRSLSLHFTDGTLGDVDQSAELTGPVFEALLDPDQF
jgi:hypothetical protein